MSNSSASMPVVTASNAANFKGRLFERRQGLLEALASLSGFALVLASWYGVNTVLKISALNVTAMIAD
jgi:cell division protein FtsB